MAAKQFDQNEMIASIMETLTQKISDKLDQKFDDFAARLSSIERSQLEIKKELKDVKLRVDSCTKEAMDATSSSKDMKQKLKEFERKLQVKDDKIDDLEQYGRKCMVEISGFPRMEGENVEKLVIELADKMKLKISESDIEACHRISTKPDAAIITEFSSRKLRDKFLSARKLIKGLSIQDLGLQIINGNKGKGSIFINESLTYRRKMLLRSAKDVKKDLNYKFIWTNKGTIFLRKSETSPAKRINKLHDLDNLNE